MSEPEGARGGLFTIVMGSRNAGKTRKASALAEQLRRDGLDVGGVIAEADLQGGIKVRYLFRDVRTGRRAVYAERKPEPVPAGSPAYLFLDDGLAFGCAAVRRDMADGGIGAIIFDEIGPLEMDGRGLWGPLREAAAVFRGRIIVTIRPSLLEALLVKLELSEDDIELIDLDDTTTTS